MPSIAPVASTEPEPSLDHEHAVLVSAYARAQARCTELVAQQAMHIEQLEATVMRLRAKVMLRDTRLDALRGSGARPSDASPTLSRASVRRRAVLCVGEDTAAATAAQRAIEGAGGRFLHQNGQDAAALEDSLVAADLVICQTGCLSHGAYWRVQDHCRRTGKACVLVDQPAAIRIVRGTALADAVPQQS